MSDMASRLFAWGVLANNLLITIELQVIRWFFAGRVFLRGRNNSSRRFPVTIASCVVLVYVSFSARPSFILLLQLAEYLEWSGTAPRSEPGQVREEAAIRDR